MIKINLCHYPKNSPAFHACKNQTLAILYAHFAIIRLKSKKHFLGLKYPSMGKKNKRRKCHAENLLKGF